jgi:hypothetical protein
VPLCFFGFISFFIVPFAILKWFGVWYGWLLFIGFWYLSLLGFCLFVLIILSPLFIIPLRGRRANNVGTFWVGVRRLANAADSKFVDKILSALEIVHHADGSWTSLSTKNALMRELEEAATIAKQALPRALRTGDGDTDVWLRKRCNEIAASLRAKKTWVCMPKSDTGIALRRA